MFKRETYICWRIHVAWHWTESLDKPRTKPFLPDRVRRPLAGLVPLMVSAARNMSSNCSTDDIPNRWSAALLLKKDTCSCMVIYPSLLVSASTNIQPIAERDQEKTVPTIELFPFSLPLFFLWPVMSDLQTKTGFGCCSIRKESTRNTKGIPSLGARCFCKRSSCKLELPHSSLLGGLRPSPPTQAKP